MFGKQCVGVTLDGDGSSFQLGAAVSAALLDMDADDGPSDVEDLARLRVCTDSMGRGIIVYWPSVEWPADAEDEDQAKRECAKAVMAFEKAYAELLSDG